MRTVVDPKHEETVMKTFDDHSEAQFMIAAMKAKVPCNVKGNTVYFKNKDDALLFRMHL